MSTIDDLWREVQSLADRLRKAREKLTAEHEQHQALGSIIAGLCAIINKYTEVNDPSAKIVHKPIRF